MPKPNENTLDRIIRVVIGLVALGLAFTVLTGVSKIAAFVVAAAGLITGIVGYCHLYTILGISTRSKK